MTNGIEVVGDNAISLGHDIEGGAAALTEMVNLQLDDRCALSVAKQDTTVDPTGNTSPDVALQVIAAIPDGSEAVTSKSTTLPEEESGSKFKFEGQ
jgi:5,10-methenyltetrahydromethanopterin hydrogenase